MRFMTATERIALVSEVASENIHEIKDKIIYDRTETGMAPVLIDGLKPIVKLDIREYIRKRMKEEGVSSYAMAKAISKLRVNLSAFLNYRCQFPLDAIEQMLWILDGKAWGDDTDNTRIIKH